MVSAPLPICPDKVSIAAPECHAPGHKPDRMESHAHGACHILEDIPAETSAEKQTSGIRVCQKGVSLLQSLEGAVSQIPGDMLSATPEHRLSVFAVELCTCVAEPGEDDWLILNQLMKSAFGWV